MKILFITHYDNLYGANNALLKLMLKLKDKGENVIVAGPDGEGGFRARVEEEGIRFISSSMTQWQAVYSSPLRFAIKEMQRKPLIKNEVQHIYEIIKDEKIDIIHTNSSVIVHGALLSEMTGAKHVWHIREFSREHFNMRYFYSGKRVNELYSKADTVVCISDALADNYRKKYKDANVVRIYDGVDAAKQTEAEYIRDYKRPITRFVYVGYLFPMKHQLEVIKACERLFAEGFTSFEMHFIGDGNQEYRSKLIKEIAKSGMGNIYLDGYVADVNASLKDMDVGIIASDYEGFGLVTVEYMLQGMPVIGKKGGGTSEIVADTVTGALYETEDEMVAAMKLIMEDRELRERLGKASYARAVNCFSEEQNAATIQKLYVSLLEETQN